MLEIMSIKMNLTWTAEKEMTVEKCSNDNYRNYYVTVTNYYVTVTNYYVTVTNYYVTVTNFILKMEAPMA